MRAIVSSATGLGHIAAATCLGNWSILLRPSGRVVVIPGESFQSRADAVIHSAGSLGDDPETVTTVWRIDGTSRDNGRPAGVADAFQVSEHSVEPILANRCRNLLSHPDSRPSGTDEAKLVGPQVPFVVCTGSFARDRERLAGAASSPQFAVVGPAGESGSERPSADAGEEMALAVSHKVIWFNIDNAPGVHVTGRDQALGDQVAQPLGREGFDFVVVAGHPCLHTRTRAPVASRAR